MSLKHNIFIPYDMANNFIKKDLDLYFIIKLYDIADYNNLTKKYDYIKYKSYSELANRLNINISTFKRKLNTEAHKYYYTIDTNANIINLKMNDKGFFKVCRADIDTIYQNEELQDKLATKLYLYT